MIWIVGVGIVLFVLACLGGLILAIDRYLKEWD